MNKKFIVFLSSRKSWTLPYIIFSAIFVVIPLVLIVVYAFTDDNGHLTLANFQKFFEHPEAINTFVYSIGIGIITTLICILLGYPAAWILSNSKLNRSKTMVVLFILQGFQQTHPLPEPDNNRQSTATGEGIADALDAIYFDVSIMGVQDATAERLASDFGVDTSCLSAVYGRYTDGRFGIADVILVVPKPGQEASARDLLVTIRTSRAGLFANYDIYGASELAENGVIYTLGDYYVLLMINDTDHVRELLEQYIPT